MRLALIIGALLMLVQAGAASAQQQSTANQSNDPEWGVLAEMAGRGFAYRGHLMTVRWVEPRHTLKLTFWGGLGSSSTIFTLNPATGEVQVSGVSSGLLTIGPDGSAMLGGRPYISRDPAGRYLLLGAKHLKDLVPGSGQDRKLQSLIASGEMPGPAATAMAVPQLAQGVAASPVVTAPIVQQDSSSISPAIAAATASSGPRYALIIGNSQYGASLGRLPNPANDAQSVAAALRAVGFDVDLVVDADQKGMKRAISRFGERLSSARGATGLFYYAGHGIQSRGTNYLIPVSAPIEREADLDLEAVAADTVLAQMEDAGAATSIVILDACRNMPLARSFRSSSRGLARMDAPNGSFIAYSTAPGAVAADGDGRNSPFAAALVKQIGQRGAAIEAVFRGVRREVVDATAGQQTPWDSSSLLDPFYFVP